MPGSLHVFSKQVNYFVQVLHKLAEGNKDIKSNISSDKEALPKVSVSPREKSAENAAVVSRNYTKHFKKELNVPFDISVWNECRKSQNDRVFTNVTWRYEVIPRVENRQYRV